jgi:hypothetical protein
MKRHLVLAIFFRILNLLTSGSAQQNDVITLKGEITNVMLPLATFVSEQQAYTVHLGPDWYWKQDKFAAAGRCGGNHWGNGETGWWVECPPLSDQTGRPYDCPGRCQS